MAAYYNIPIEEMRELFRPEKGWKEAEATGHIKEKVFQYNLKKHPFILINVYSGIVNNESRGVGRDAIRVSAVNLRNNSGWIKAKRVHRVKGWRHNLQTRVLQVISDSNKRFRVLQVISDSKHDSKQAI